MIKQYLDYKISGFQKVLNSSMIIPSEKKKFMDDYSRFLSYFKQDEHGRVIINKKICKEMMRLLEEGKIPFVIDQYDMAISLDSDMPNSCDYEFQSISDFVAVHKSAIIPSDDKIVTPEDSGFTKEIYFNDPGTGMEHVVPYVVGNDTIHFTLNCSVENHEAGNDWDSYKYAVVIGLDKLDKSKILDVKSEDTYVDGSCELGDDYYIFCPVGEKEVVLDSNPHATVIEYSGITLNEAVSRLIIYLGKKLEPYGTYGWGRDSDYLPEFKDNKILNGILEREGYPNLVGVFGPALHSETKYMSRRMWKREYEALINLIEYNKKNGIDMPDEVMNMILTYGGAYSLPGNVPVSIETYKEFVVPILEKHGYQIDDSFFEEIDFSSGDIKIINSYPTQYGMMPCVQCPEWEVELRNRAIKFIKEYEYTDKKKNTK